ncbi:alpha/beta hydrolase [Nocardioides bigeumensis]|uniref:Alpha/beta hydrolase n=1 Tax=Nocardioides bigeumensis TaxID=433657 RepID=A0ABP5K7X4_9ACTN
MSRRAAVAVLCAVLLLTTTGCPGGEDGEPPRAAAGNAWEPQPCPSDVEVLVVPSHSCGWVEAPLGDSAQQVFVVVVEPATPSDDAPILETGTDLGMVPNYAGLAPIAQRTGRRTAIVDLPGTGHSVPSLDCPDAEAVGDVSRDDPVLLDAIGDCRDRLLAEGVDPALMTPARSAEALLAVMDALDEGPWVLMGHGTTSALAVEVARANPARVEAVVMDTPVHAHRGWPARRAALIRAVAAACDGVRRCLRRHGDVRDLWTAARLRARTDPVHLGGRVLDLDLLDRAVRWLVAPVAAGPARLPALLEEAARGRRGPVLEELGAALEEAPPLCVGILPKCSSRRQVVLGAVLSSVCAQGAGAAEYARPCELWGVAEHPDEAAPALEVPVLVLQGAFDPYASPAEVTDVVEKWAPDAHVVVAPDLGHNVLGDECVRSIRSAWLAGNSDRAPEIPACLDEEMRFP